MALCSTLKRSGPHWCLFLYEREGERERGRERQREREREGGRERQRNREREGEREGEPTGQSAGWQYEVCPAPHDKSSQPSAVKYACVTSYLMYDQHELLRNGRRSVIR